MAEPVLTLTDAAADRVRHLVAKSEKPILGLRVGVSTRGCNGLTYTIEYAEDKRDLDEVVPIDGATVFVDPLAVMYLVGSQMDWVEDKLESRFTFTNPNEKGRCGCGESFNV
jgi:iron-sulfur cluster assembly accessory protein